MHLTAHKRMRLILPEIQWLAPREGGAEIEFPKSLKISRLFWLVFIDTAESFSRGSSCGGGKGVQAPRQIKRIRVVIF